MIDPKELRIGNYIKEWGDGIGRVLAIHGDGDVVCSCNNLALPAANFWAIPLIPDVLLKCGFKWSGESHLETGVEGDKNLAFLCKDGLIEKMLFYLDDDHDDGSFSIVEFKPPKFLHQLQNLYFALTGKELDITL